MEVETTPQSHHERAESLTEQPTGDAQHSHRVRLIYLRGDQP